MYNLSEKVLNDIYTYNFDIESGKQLYKKKMYSVFDVRRIPVIYKSERNLRYDIYLKNSMRDIPYMMIQVKENGHITRYSCALCTSYSFCEHLICMLLAIEKMNYTNDCFEKEFLELEEQDRIAHYEEKKKELENKIAPLVQVIRGYDVVGLNEKMSVEPHLIMDKGIRLSIKVGGSKKYVVQSIPNFLRSVSLGEIVSYGKKFSFNHALDNFDDISQRLIMFLASHSYNDTTNYKQMELSQIKLQNLMSILVGNYLWVELNGDEAKQYLVTEEVKQIKLRLDKKYRLSIIIDDGLFIVGYSKDYLCINNKIYESSITDNSLRSLLAFIVSNEDFSYDYVKDIFKKEIYPRFHDYIEIDESLADELKLVDYVIKGYFDINDDGLFTYTKYYCNGTEVDVSEMSAISYKLTKYNSIIQGFGFDEKGFIKDSVKIYFFLKADFSVLRSISEIYLSDNIKNMQTKSVTKMSTYLTYNTGMLDVCFEKSSFSDDELDKIIKSLKKKVRYIRLNKDTIVEVDEETAEKMLNTVDEFNLNTKSLTVPQSVPLYQTLKLESDELNIVNYNIDNSLQNLLTEIRSFKKSDFKVPNELNDIMRPYQKEAFKWMKTLIKHNFCGILADDMGLGKTIEIISVLLDDQEKEPILIVCPKSLCYNWKNEFDLWAPDLDVVNIIGPANERSAMIETIKKNKKVIYITSYDSLRNDIASYKGKKFRFLILDEAQSIKNRETMKAKSVKEVSSKLRFVLTGTPIENTIIDLWSIFDFLMPNYLSSYLNFKGRYEKSIVEQRDSETIKRLVKKISPFVLRRTKKEVLKDLPDKIETIQMASMDTPQRKIYEAQLKKTRDILESEENNKILLLSCLTRLRQICVDPGLFMDDYKEQSAKIDLVMDLISSYIFEGHKIILFSQFTTIFDKLQDLFSKQRIKNYVLTGKTSAEERMRLANEFNKPDNDCNVFLVSLKAGGVGLNLVGADIVIHLDPWWNYAVENQATDRAHRIGQKNSVQVIKVICENSIEQKVIELQRIKKEVADRIILSDEDNYNNITVNDLKYLLK